MCFFILFKIFNSIARYHILILEVLNYIAGLTNYSFEF